MIPSEAPLLHNQVKLVDPMDRQAPWGSGQVVSHRLNGGLDALEVEKGHPNTEVAVKQDGDLSISSH